MGKTGQEFLLGLATGLQSFTQAFNRKAERDQAMQQQKLRDERLWRQFMMNQQRYAEQEKRRGEEFAITSDQRERGMAAAESRHQQSMAQGQERLDLSRSRGEFRDQATAIGIQQRGRSLDIRDKAVESRGRTGKLWWNSRADLERVFGPIVNDTGLTNPAELMQELQKRFPTELDQAALLPPEPSIKQAKWSGRYRELREQEEYADDAAAAMAIVQEEMQKAKAERQELKSRRGRIRSAMAAAQAQAAMEKLRGGGGGGGGPGAGGPGGVGGDAQPSPTAPQSGMGYLQQMQGGGPNPRAPMPLDPAQMSVADQGPMTMPQDQMRMGQAAHFFNIIMGLTPEPPTMQEELEAYAWFAQNTSVGRMPMDLDQVATGYGGPAY